MIYFFKTLQRIFSRTFRKKAVAEKESDEDKQRDYYQISKEQREQIIQTHSNFHHFGRLLREMVECFGMRNNFGYVTVYHGVTGHRMFESLFAFVKGPFSTTTAYNVAEKFAGGNGLILELKIDTKSWILGFDEGEDAINRINCFECRHLSDYPNEQEIFNIGGLNRFHFVNIIERQTGTKYAKCIKGIKQFTTGMTHGGIAADTLDFDFPETNEERQIAYSLLSHQCYKYLPNHEHAHEFKICPEYVKKFMDSHCKHIKSMHIVEKERKEFVDNKTFDMFFRNNDNDWIFLDDVMAIFPGVEHIQYYAHNKDISFVEDVIKELLPLFERQYGLNGNEDDNKDDNQNNDIEYPGIVITVDPEFGEDALKLIIDEYERPFDAVGWELSCYYDNVAVEMMKKRVALDPLAKTIGFTEESIDALLQNIESDNILGKWITNEAQKFIESTLSLFERYNTKEILATWCKQAQQKEFDIFKHWNKLETLYFQISPS